MSGCGTPLILPDHAVIARKETIKLAELKLHTRSVLHYSLLTTAKVMHLHSKFGRLMRSSSLQPLRCHTRMQPREQVANTSPYW
jgi:hypothetical protein